MLTVRDLLLNETLGISALAGFTGLDRTITWAHAVDLCDPWKWVAAGNLVMTTGIGLPGEAGQQVRWLEQLADSQACALLVAARADSAPLTAQLLDCAERLGFPLLSASFELAFVRLSQLIIESVLQTQRERLSTSERLFQTYAQVLRKRPDFEGRLILLAESLGLDLLVEDALSGLPIVASRQAQVPASPEGPLERVSIPGIVPASLVIITHGKKVWGDPLLVRSLVGLLSIELERLAITRDEQREAGATLLRNLLTGQTELSVARPLLERRGLSGTLVCSVLEPGQQGAWCAETLHHAPGLHYPAPLLLADEGVLLMLSNDAPALFEHCQANLGNGSRAGISAPASVAAGVSESLRQARLALAQARELGLDMLRYGEARSAAGLTPKSLAEARALLGHYLAALIEHDRSQDGELLKTLATFLDNDGNWKETAFDLGIHRQTLVYRIKRIEQLSGFSPTTTRGSAQLWMALQAGISTGLLDDLSKWRRPS